MQEVSLGRPPALAPPTRVFLWNRKTLFPKLKQAFCEMLLAARPGCLWSVHFIFAIACFMQWKCTLDVGIVGRLDQGQL